MDELGTARARRAIGLEVMPLLFFENNPPYFCFFKSNALIDIWPQPLIFKTIVLNFTTFLLLPLDNFHVSRFYFHPHVDPIYIVGIDSMMKGWFTIDIMV